MNAVIENLKTAGGEILLRTKGQRYRGREFEDIVVRALANGSVVRIKDVGRVELGAEEYDWDIKTNGKPSAFLVISQLANANGLDIKKAVLDTMQRLEKNFPEDVAWSIKYDTTKFISSSVHEVIVTLIEAVLLVILVVYLFLQNMRATLIPVIAVPVSLIGTLAFMLAFDFSINILTLLGLVLAVALVVDDAIVVVENVMRKLEEGATDLKQATRDAIAEVRSPIIATTLVLIAVFVPVSFIPGMTGLLYNQFALTIAVATIFSSINALSMTPALASLLLRLPPVELQRGGITAPAKIQAALQYLLANSLDMPAGGVEYGVDEKQRMRTVIALQGLDLVHHVAGLARAEAFAFQQGIGAVAAFEDAAALGLDIARAAAAQVAGVIEQMAVGVQAIIPAWTALRRQHDAGIVGIFLSPPQQAGYADRAAAAFQCIQQRHESRFALAADAPVAL